MKRMRDNIRGGMMLVLGGAAAGAVGWRAQAQDFNADGFADCAWGAPGESVGAIASAGAVNVVYGAPPGLLAGAAPLVPAQLWHQNRPGIVSASAAGDDFGSALAWGDYDGDGFDDLAVGIPGKTVGGAAGAGMVHILYGGPAGLSAAGDVTLTQPFFGEVAEVGDGLGWALAGGDVNGDGIDDLVIAAPFEDLGVADAGMIHVALGLAAGGFMPGAVPIIIQAGIGEFVEMGDTFGRAIAIGDLDGDAFEDTVVSAPDEDLGGIPDAGFIHILSGGPGGPLTGPIMMFPQAALGDPSEPFDEFGNSIAIGDIDANGVEDLVIGVALEDLGGIVDAGMIMTVGYAPGGAILGLMPFTQTTFGVDMSEPTDEFGYSVALGDLNGDAFADILAGSPGEALGGLADVGLLSIIPGGPGGPGTGPVPTFWSQATAGVLDGIEVLDRLGELVAAGDFNGDGFLDALASVPFEDLAGVADCGMLHTLYGSPIGITAAMDQIWHQNKGGVPEANEVADLQGILNR